MKEKFAPPIALRDIKFNIALTITNGSEGMAVTAKTSPPFNDNVDWVGFLSGSVEATGKPINPGTYSFTYTQEHGLRVEDMPMVDEGLRAVLVDNMKVAMGKVFTDLANAILNWPQEPLLRVATTEIHRAALGCYLRHVKDDGYEIQSPPPITIEHVTNPDKFGIKIEDEDGSVLRAALFGQVGCGIMGMTHGKEPAGSHVIQVAMPESGVFSQWLGMALTEQVQVMAQEVMPQVIQDTLAQLRAGYEEISTYIRNVEAAFSTPGGTR